MNITGNWASNDAIAAIHDVHLELTQGLDGTVNGHWSAENSSPDAPCPPSLGSTPAGALNGRHTILQVQLSLVGLGDFAGQAIDGQVLKGSLETCGQVYPMIFTLQATGP
ncbi:MAG: hypothetical protein ACR2NS_06750 [Gemmatimonadaceae bacterium]